MPQVDKHKVVTIDYTLKNDEGQVIDSSEGKEPLSYVHGIGSIIPGLENALEGKQPEEAVNVSLSPDEAYGERDEQMIQDVPREQFDTEEEIQEGMQFQAMTSGGPRVVTVVGVGEENITIDANHPLAGQTLNFDVAVREVRDATEEEVNHGHTHGADDQQEH